MSNPNFPVPSWQDQSPSAELEPYGRGSAGQATGYGRTPGRSADDGDGAADGQGYRGSAEGGYQGYGGRGYDARRGYTDGGNGRDYADRGGYGYGRSQGNGRDDYGRSDYGRDDYGRSGDRLSADTVRRADEYAVGVTDEELYRPGGPSGPDGPDGPGGGRGRGGGGGSGRGSGNWFQRQWHASWWRRWTIKKAGLVVGGVAAGMVLVLVAGFFYLYSSVPLPLQELSTPPIQSSEVLFSNGQPIGCFCVQNRTVLSTTDLARDPALEEAFLAAEDRNFWHEGGISLTGTVRALLVDLSGGGSQGGSTITEQFVKNYLVPSGGGLTFKEKLKEIIISIKLANRESKSWILQHYLNVIDLGSGAYGVQAAAETYFGVPAWKVSVPQAAMLGAMVQQPYGFDPTHPAQNAPGLGYSLLDRWIYVLGNMARDTPGITQQLYNSLVPYPSPSNAQQTQADLKNFPKVKIRNLNSSKGYRFYLMNLVKNELEAYYGLNYAQLTSQGYQVKTTIDQHLMNTLYSTVRSDKQMINQYAAQQPGTVRLPRWAQIGVVLEQPKTGAIKALYAGPGFGTKHCVACDYGTGTILQPVQVGSSFKPYVLTTAVSQGMNAKTSILDSHSPICIPPADEGPKYQLQLSTFGIAHCDSSIGFYPLNQQGENYKQSLTVPTATAVSSNPAFEDLIHRTSVYKVLDMAKELGVSGSTYLGLVKMFGSGGAYPGSVTAALGQGTLTVVDQANTFATLVSNGWTALPHVISSVTLGNQQLPVPPVYQAQKRLGPYVAADADYALSWDTTLPGATGHNAYIGRPMIGKTGTLGTLTHASEAWFVGAIPQYSMAVALYADRPANEYLDSLPAIGGWSGSYGGAWPATIWGSIMKKLIVHISPAPLPTPNWGAPFVKWVQVRPMKQKKCTGVPPWFGGGGGPGGPGGPGGGGNGNGHHHHHGSPVGALLGQKQCKKGSPSPSPTPSPSPSGSPTPSPTPSPSPSGSPTPTPSLPGARHALASGSVAPAPAPGPRPRSAAPSLTVAAVLQRQPSGRPLRAPVATGRL